MAFIKSISGFRGTIGGVTGENLTPLDIVECASAFGQWVIENVGVRHIVVGRDGRISGEIVSALVISSLRALGIDVTDLGLSTTPTVEMAVPALKAGGGIILTASHNPKEWNALKLLNHKGEFISKSEGETVLALAGEKKFEYAGVAELGAYRTDQSFIAYHIQQILELPLVNVEKIKAQKFKVVLDAINSTGAISVPPLLEALGCETILINGEITGNFAHNPEPLAEHLRQLSSEVTLHKAHLGIAVDPDVDRLVFMSEDGELFGEEYTLVAVADYVLSKIGGGNTVSNLSSTRALSDVTARYGGRYEAAAVGEVHVVEKMKAVGAAIGGEGNGGVIYPDLHYGRDALVGIALFLSHLSETGLKMSKLRASYPDYQMVKSKINLSAGMDVSNIIANLAQKYRNERINTEDGLKIDFEEGWVHLRPSNTEPIMRVYAESHSSVIAENLVKKIMHDLSEISNA